MTNGTPTTTATMTPVEAERRFFAKYGESAGTTWAAVQGFLGTPAPKPTTVQGWIALAEQVRDQIADLAYAEDQLFPEGTQAPAAAVVTAEPSVKYALNHLARIASSFESIARDFGRMATAMEKMAEQPPVATRPAATGKPEAQYGDDGIPICPKHNRRMKVSNYGGYFCTAPDPEANNGKCTFKVK